MMTWLYATRRNRIVKPHNSVCDLMTGSDCERQTDRYPSFSDKMTERRTLRQLNLHASGFLKGKNVSSGITQFSLIMALNTEITCI
jgi:hypothetical protein